MKKSICFILVLFSFVLILQSCKKKFKDGEVYKSPLTSYVVSNTSLNVLSTPELSGKIIHSLLPNSEFKILEHGIVNTANEKIRWFRIEQEKNSGYLSEQVLENKEIAKFKENNQTTETFVSASSLRIRKNPSLTGEVLTSLPLGSKVEIVAVGMNSEFIDEKYDYWVKVKTSDGKIGFCFNGYLISNLEKEWNEEVYSGFIEIKNKFTILETPLKEKSPKSADITVEGNYFSTAGENSIYPVKTKATINDKVYYSVNEKYSNCEYDYCDGSGIISFWISAEDVEYFNSSLLDYTFNKYGFENLELLNFVKSKIGKGIDVRKIKLTSLGENSEGTSFGLLEINLSTDYNKNWDNNSKRIIQNQNAQFSEIYSAKNDEYILTHDFDKDAIPEISISSGGRMNSNVIFYSIRNNRLAKLIELESGEYYQENGNSYEASYSINEDKITVKKTQNEKTNTVVYLYQNGKFVKQK